MPTSTPQGSASVAEKLEFQSAVRSADRTNGAVTLVDESASARVLARGASTGIGVAFGRSVRRGDGVLVCGTRPDEWTLLGDFHRASDIVESVPTDGFAIAVDQTHGRAMMRLAGSESPDIMEKICSIDFGDHMMPNGAVVSASVAKVTCDIIRDDVEGARSYLLVCDRSFAAYLFEAVADAGSEFGLS